LRKSADQAIERGAAQTAHVCAEIRAVQYP
jgi:hypothetical protein